jgi:hypothetical protein
MLEIGSRDMLSETEYTLFKKSREKERERIHCASS